MNKNTFETALGAFVLIVAVIFLILSYRMSNVSSGSGFTILADFSGIGGLKAGDSVQISGVKIGTVSDVSLNTETYLARVSMDIDDNIQIPDDTAALISSESLLGGRYMLLEPGASETYLEDGGRVIYTQAPQNLEQLLGQFIFSVQDSKGEDTSSDDQFPEDQDL
ncbi:MAG: outer membrane lipid asymmetry maintenance protein MlaD [Alphaproteobacteria bacterium]|nr:outer membrane lipid asymmetry maintenance protein MlaD [Alphaproteobacteria bacterium]